MKAVILACCCLIGMEAFAGTRVNNGGGAWTCREFGSPGAIRWMRLVDLFEGVKELGLEVPDRGNIDPWQLFLEKAALIRAEVPQLQNMLTTDEKGIYAAINIVSSQSGLVKIRDGAWRVWPEESSCKEGVLYYSQIANYTDDGRLLIARELFLDPVFSPTDRGALYVHELVYKALRERKGDTNSYRSRLIVGALFSTLTPAALRAKVDEILKMPIPPDQSGAPVDNLKLECQMAVATIGEQEGSLSTKAMPEIVKGKVTESNSHGFRFRVQTDPARGFPVGLSLLDNETGVDTEITSMAIQPIFQKYKWVSLTLKSKPRGIYAVLNCWATSFQLGI